MEKGNLFKSIREQNDTKFDLKSDPNVKSILKDHVMLREGLSDNALVSLIVLVNGYDLNEDCEHELSLFGYIDESGKLTKLGKTFIEEDETINRLKEMI